MNGIYSKSILIFYISFWLAVGVAPQTINYDFNSLPDIINIFRICAPLILSIILLVIIIFLKLKNFNKNYKKNYLSINNLFLVFFILQLIGLYQNNLIFNLQNLYLIILGFGSLQLFTINTTLNNDNHLKHLLYASIVIFFLSSGILFYFLICENYYAYKDIIFTDLRSFTDNRLGDNYFLNNSYPRSTGISRSFVVINIFITIFILFFINGKWKSKFLFYIASFLFSLLISLLQSRGSALMFFLTFAAILYFAKKIDLKKKISLLFLIIFLPFLISKIISFTFYNLNISDKFENYNTNVIFNNSNLNNNFYNFIFKDRLINNKSSSGRVDIWKESFKKYDKKKIFGYGPQGDRFLLTKNNYSNNSSNALIYSLLSGGYFAFLIFLLIYFNILTKIYICIKKFKIFENNVDLEIKLSISFVIFLFLRSFFENSFSLFSLDFLLFICSVAYIDDYLKKKAYSKFSFLKYS
jgi:hypothetical protein